ncbi:hypothetical protein C8R45DRAFT_360254 [Mycena sanguinolenta]|nr:hypothetical protein C8R45DRAFT_360254 [Mycena sanguinolenta]
MLKAVLAGKILQFFVCLLGRCSRETSTECVTYFPNQKFPYPAFGRGLYARACEPPLPRSYSQMTMIFAPQPGAPAKYTTLPTLPPFPTPGVLPSE